MGLPVQLVPIILYEEVEIMVLLLEKQICMKNEPILKHFLAVTLRNILTNFFSSLEKTNFGEEV